MLAYVSRGDIVHQADVETLSGYLPVLLDWRPLGVLVEFQLNANCGAALQPLAMNIARVNFYTECTSTEC